MIGRTVAEMVADLRRCWPTSGNLDLITEVADLLERLEAEVVKLRAEVGDVMRSESKMRRSFSKWTHRLNRRIQKLKANIADEELYIDTLRTRLAALDASPPRSVKP